MHRQRCPLPNLHQEIPISDLVLHGDMVQIQGRDVGSLKPGGDGVVAHQLGVSVIGHLFFCPLFLTGNKWSPRPREKVSFYRQIQPLEFQNSQFVNNYQLK